MADWQLPPINPGGAGGAGEPFPGYSRWLQWFVGQITARPIVSGPGYLPRPAPAPVPGVPGRAPVRVPPKVPGRPSGPTVADRFPGRTSAPVLGAILSRVAGWGAGLLFWPTEAGRGSDLCRKTSAGIWCEPVVSAVPAPAIPGTRAPGRGRRPRAVGAPGGVLVPPRRRERPRAAAPVVPPRGRPVTISRPLEIPRPRMREAVLPAPRPVYPPGAATAPIARPQAHPVSLPRASTVPATLPATLPRILPVLGAVVLPALGSWVTTGAVTMPRITAPTRPNVRPRPRPDQSPAANPSPLLRPGALTAFARAPALSPAQELDQQCRERAKRKRKKRKPRSVCYRGTYTESKTRTTKHRKEKIPCR